MDLKACSIIAWREDEQKEHTGLPGWCTRYKRASIVVHVIYGNTSARLTS